MIDLHIHSTASDGSLNPSEIIQTAIDKGLKAIAITDHDTIDGVKQAIEAGIPGSLEFLTGVEISAQPLPGFSICGSLHILGYGFSIYDKALSQALAELRKARADRNPQIIKKLNQLGMPLTLDEVSRMCGPCQIGRPHIAQAMVKKGFVETFDQAFDEFLSTGKPAYVDKSRVSCQEAIHLITNAGGIAVLAHPGLIQTNGNLPLETLINSLSSMGLKGLEVFYTDHTAEQTAYFENLAKQKNLLMTGGTDFHGNLKQGVQMGSGNGTLSMEPALIKPLLAEIDSVKLETSGLEILQENLGYRFNNQTILEHALRHSSFVNELQDKTINDNQRLEFLGDAVLGLCVGQLIMERHPEMNEGNLSKFRANLVSESGLATMARQIDLGRFISLGKGERLSRGSEKNSILADTFEAVIAAVYRDSSFETAYQLIQDHFAPLIDVGTNTVGCEDYKSMLQEYVQEIGNSAPSYEIAQEIGPDHDKTFEIAVNVCNIESSGLGKSKKAAEQNAAQNALKILKGLDS